MTVASIFPQLQLIHSVAKQQIKERFPLPWLIFSLHAGVCIIYAWPEMVWLRRVSLEQWAVSHIHKKTKQVFIFFKNA